MRKNIWIVFLIVFALLVFCVVSCDYGGSTADKEQAEITETLMIEANKQAGMPNMVNFQQKKLMKMIYELCDKEDLICYAYLFSEYTGELVFIGRCVGFGIPFSAQYSNPEVMKYYGSGYGYGTMPQPEPNGLFMPTSSSATWLIMIDPETDEPRPVYFEPTIVVSPFKLQ